MIKQITIRNFKSLEDVTLALEPVTVLIGRSGSGKSNLVQAIKWLRDFLLTRNPQQALQSHGGQWSRVICATAKDATEGLSFSVSFDAPGFREEFGYGLSFRRSAPQADPTFFEESLTLERFTTALHIHNDHGTNRWHHVE